MHWPPQRSSPAPAHALVPPAPRPPAPLDVVPPRPPSPPPSPCAVPPEPAPAPAPAPLSSIPPCAPGPESPPSAAPALPPAEGGAPPFALAGAPPSMSPVAPENPEPPVPTPPPPPPLAPARPPSPAPLPEDAPALPPWAPDSVVSPEHELITNSSRLKVKAARVITGPRYNSTFTALRTLSIATRIHTRFQLDWVTEITSQNAISDGTGELGEPGNDAARINPRSVGSAPSCVISIEFMTIDELVPPLPPSGLSSRASCGRSQSHSG
jgi:hypothetical protein